MNIHLPANVSNMDCIEDGHMAPDEYPCHSQHISYTAEMLSPFRSTAHTAPPKLGYDPPVFRQPGKKYLD